jgi:hypothetical protein
MHQINKCVFMLLLVGFLSGPTIPPSDDDEQPGGTKLTEIDMPVCYPCDSNLAIV